MVTSTSAWGVFLSTCAGCCRQTLHRLSGEEHNLPKIDVAVVEDDDSVREAMGRLLRLLGYSAAAFASAEEFLNSDILGNTACLITDIHLPGMSGIELQSRLVSAGHHIPIIFVTAFAEEAVRARVLGDGALACLSKPLREQSLITCLDRALKHPRQGST
jgi:FixJ family two-component response regulator